MVKRIVALLLMLPCMAWAQTPSSVPLPDAGDFPPRPTGDPHLCRLAVSSKLATNGTKLHFTVTADGGVKDITVVESSGVSSLDSAAVTCVSGWRYIPATIDGKPVEVSWVANIDWRVMP
jgi:TonB family protein